MITNSVLTINGKGGVGKTSLVANIAGLAAASGWRVLAIDITLVTSALGANVRFVHGDALDPHAELIHAAQYAPDGVPAEQLPRHVTLVEHRHVGAGRGENPGRRAGSRSHVVHEGACIGVVEHQSTISSRWIRAARPL